MFLNANNKADGNVYVDMPARFQGYGEGDAKQYLDLAAWRDAHGWDKNSVMADAQIDFDPDTLQLTIASRQPLPRVSAVNQIESDMLGKDAGRPGLLARWQIQARSGNGRLILAHSPRLCSTAGAEERSVKRSCVAVATPLHALPWRRFSESLPRTILKATGCPAPDWPGQHGLPSIQRVPGPALRHAARGPRERRPARTSPHGDRSRLRRAAPSRSP